MANLFRCGNGSKSHFVYRFMAIGNQSPSKAKLYVPDGAKTIKIGSASVNSSGVTGFIIIEGTTKDGVSTEIRNTRLTFSPGINDIVEDISNYSSVTITLAVNSSGANHIAYAEDIEMVF